MGGLESASTVAYSMVERGGEMKQELVPNILGRVLPVLRGDSDCSGKGTTVGYRTNLTTGKVLTTRVALMDREKMKEMQWYLAQRWT